VPWLVLVAAGYGTTLYLRHETFTQVIQTIGIFGLVLLAVCAWFTWGVKEKRRLRIEDGG